MSVITDLIPTTLPAYHEKYRVGGYNRLGKLCYASILRRIEASGGNWPIEVNGAGASPVTTSTSYADKDFFSPVSGSSCKISMVAESYSQLLELGRGDDTMWKVEVVDDGDTIFRGFLKPETFQMEYGYEKPVVNVDATDGLGVLRNVEFAEGETFSGAYSTREIISYLLYIAGNRVNWQDWVNYGIRGVIDRNIYNSIEIPLYKYIGWTCYEVLEDILGIIDAQIISIDGTYIIRLGDVASPEDADVYTYRGAYVNSINLTEKKYSLYDYDGASGRLQVEKPIKDIEYSANREAIENLVYNGDFLLGSMGWSQWGGEGELSTPHWRINNKYKYLELDKKVLGEFEAPPWFDDGVQFDIFRGNTTRTINLRVTFDVRIPTAQATITVWTRINSLAAKGVNITADGQWHQISHIFTLHSGATEAYLRIARPLLAGQCMHIRDVQVQAGQTFGITFNQIEDEKNTELIDINDDGVQTIKHEPYRAFGGSQYMYNNAFPGITEKTTADIYDRTSDLYINNSALQRMRVQNFYNTVRTRLSIDLFCKDENEKITAESILFDKYLERNFVIMSSTYDIIRAKYSLELMEYERASTYPPTWILAIGTWNDDGYWVDTEQWNDTDPN